jgi:hypothetical protein
MWPQVSKSLKCLILMKTMFWTRYIDRLHSNDREWHYSVDSICLNTKGKVALLLNAMHDINK